MEGVDSKDKNVLEMPIGETRDLGNGSVTRLTEHGFVFGYKSEEHKTEDKGRG